jgi:hypothetical protein
MNIKSTIILVLLFAICLLAGEAIFHFIIPRPQESGANAPAPSPSAGAKGDQGLEFTSNPSEPITFLTGTLDVTISKKSDTSAAADASYLVSHAKACGPGERPASYFSDLAKIMDKLPKTVYTISTINGKTRYHVSVMPNLLGYKDLFSAQADFFSCKEDAGHLRAMQLTPEWIAFGQSCAIDDADCQRIAAVIDSSIRIK